MYFTKDSSNAMNSLKFFCLSTGVDLFILCFQNLLFTFTYSLNIFVTLFRGVENLWREEQNFVKRALQCIRDYFYEILGEKQKKVIT